MNNEDRVRDIYMYKRGHPCPTVKLEKVDKQLMYKKRQQQVHNIFEIFEKELIRSKIFDYHGLC